MTAVASNPFQILYDVKARVTTSGAVIQYDVKQRISKSASIEYDVRSRVSKSASIVYSVRMFVYPAKVANILYAVRSRVSKSFSVRYDVRVPVSPPKTGVIRYHVRSRVSSTPKVIQYDTEVSGTTTVSRSFVIRYNTLVTPTEDMVITVPVNAGEVPPQIKTTSL